MGLVGFAPSQKIRMTLVCSSHLIVKEMFLTCTALLGVPETNLSGCTGHFLPLLLTDTLGIEKEDCSAWVKHIWVAGRACLWQCRKEDVMQCLSECQRELSSGDWIGGLEDCWAAQRSEVADWVYHRRGRNHITQGSSKAIVFWLAMRKGIPFKEATAFLQ